MKRVLRRVVLLLFVLHVPVVAYSIDVVVQARRATTRIVDDLMKSGRIVLRPMQFQPGWMAALLKVEDPQFITHDGIDLLTPGAGLTTITQGLVKRLYFERFTPGFAKLKQTLIAVFALDAIVSKRTQLILFINTVYLGENEGQSVNGFTQGAQVYFRKRFEDLSTDEYLALVAMIIAPNTFHVRLHPEENASRVDRIKRLLAGQYRPKGLLDVYYDRPGPEDRGPGSALGAIPNALDSCYDDAMPVSSKHRMILGVGFLVVAGVVYWILAGPRGSDEERIRRAIEDIRVAVEARSAKTIVEHLALNYHDAEGMGRQEIRQSLVGHFFQSKAALTCVAITQSVEVSEDKRNANATVFAAIFEGGSLTALELPEGGDAFRIEARFAKEPDGDWRAVWHERERVTVQTVLELARGD